LDRKCKNCSIKNFKYFDLIALFLAKKERKMVECVTNCGKFRTQDQKQFISFSKISRYAQTTQKKQKVPGNTGFGSGNAGDYPRPDFSDVFDQWYK
jgi:hypothetical protein